jgi:outer membrane lipase/esterase
MRNFLQIWITTLMCAAAANAAPFSRFVIFGNSLSDNGNAFIGTGAAIPAPPLYTAMRFTDGPDTTPAGGGDNLGILLDRSENSGV